MNNTHDSDASDTAVVSNVSSAAVKNAAATALRRDLKKRRPASDSTQKVKLACVGGFGYGTVGAQECGG